VTASALRAVLPDAYFGARTDLDARAATPASTAGARLTPDAVYDHAMAAADHCPGRRGADSSSDP